jgi:hypothetical protein
MAPQNYHNEKLLKIGRMVVKMFVREMREI